MEENKVLFQVGYVIGQFDNTVIYGIKVLWFPGEGIVLSPGRPARHFALKPDGAVKIQYGAKTGQGGMYTRHFDLERTHPDLLTGGLKGSFLAHSSHPLALTQMELLLHLDYQTLFPFILTPESEEQSIREGTIEQEHAWFDKPYQVGVSYPIEISAVEIPYTKWIGRTYRRGLAVGVFELKEPLQNGVGVASVRLVYEEPFWDPAASEFFLYRYGRPIGTARKV